ncbi:transposase [Thermoanaerobacterium butyriciformans]|uniref:Transposase n=1 Tax=Thermoanaerobacterium butyriciformans TaxID=1702242 RepID=A0ABS4NJJ9_9THEO|nr:transposase [Thermoanaerobacterium butyriciformans]
MEIKPNFSEIAREYGVDRRTVRKYYEGYEGKPKTRNKQSNLDKYYDEIKAKTQQDVLFHFLYKDILTFTHINNTSTV